MSGSSLPPSPRGAIAQPSAAIAVEWQQLIDAMDCGIVVYDAQDRLLVCNADFRRLYAPMAGLLRPGLSFEQLLREAVSRGLIPETAGHEEQWVQQRLRAHTEPSAPMIRRQADGRWRRIVEKRLADGGLLAFSFDITDQVEKTRALEHALEAGQLAQQRLEDAVEALPAGYELWDRDDRLVMCNSELQRQYPQITDLLRPGMTWEDLVRANQARGGLPVPAAELDAYIADRRALRRQAQAAYEHATGGGRWIRSSASPTRDGGLVGVRVDITELRQQREAAERAQRIAEQATQRLHDAIEALSEGFALFDADDRLVLCNTRYRALYDRAASAVVVGNSYEAIVRHGLEQGQFPQAAGREESWLRERVEHHRHPLAAELVELPGNRWVRIEERRTADGGIAGVRSDVTELVRRQQELARLNAELDLARARLEELSETDALTGIANRRRFDRRLAEEWARLERHGVPLALLLIDIDHFKRFNDRHGHPAGDDCLRRAGRLLEACARRASDVVARYGGEEFAVLMPHADADAAMAQALRCIAAVDVAAIPHGDSPIGEQVSLSVGVAHATRAAGDASTLLRSADLALYAAKAAGRHRAQLGVYPPP